MSDVPDRGPAVLAVTVATFVVGSVFVLARVVCRLAIVRRFGWDDAFIVLAWLVALGLSLAISLGVRNGLGRHDADIEASTRGRLRMCEYVFSILYNPALMATKTSILVFYLRLSKTTQRTLRWGSYGILAVGNVAGTVLMLINIFQCRPVRAAFSSPLTDGGHCIPLLTEFICSAPINIVTDLAILSLPIPVLTAMHLPPRQKTILVLTFALGIFVTVVDVVRVYYLQQAIYTPATTSTSSTSSNPESIFGEGAEFAWNASLSLMWSAVEVNIGMACACIPTLKPLMIKFVPAMLVDRDRDRDRDGGADGADGTQVASSSSSPFARDARTLVDDDVGPTARSTSRSTRKQKSVYFGFVKLHAPKSMLKATAPQSLRYCTMVAVLFFLWGFSYGLLNTLNNAVADVADMTTTQTLGLTSAYFGGGYLFGPLVVGEWILRHDEHHRRRSSAGGAGDNRKSDDHHHHHSLPAAVSAAATTVTRRRSSASLSDETVGGFKATFIVGLCFYGVGTTMFWPSSVLTSFAGFLISNFVVGFGLSILETAANPFIALCGPAALAEVRLLLVQGGQGIGSVLSGLLAQHVFFVDSGTNNGTTNTKSLLDVQWTYLAITLFCAALAMFFYYMPLPELPDAELAVAARRLPMDGTKPTKVMGLPLQLQLRTVSLLVAIVAQWTYVAAQESMSIYFYDVVTSWLPGGRGSQQQQQTVSSDRITMAMTSTGTGSSSAANDDHPAGLALSVPSYMLVCRSAFAVSRLAAALVVYLGVRRPANRWLPSPRSVLLVSSALMVLSALLVAVLQPDRSTPPNLVIVPVCLFFLAEGPIFPLIFALGLRGQGTRTKRAAAFITMGSSGPLFWPYVMYAILRGNGGSIRVAFVVVVVLAGVSMLYPVYLTCSRDARELASVVPEPNEELPSSSRQTRSGPGEINDVGGLLDAP